MQNNFFCRVMSFHLSLQPFLEKTHNECQDNDEKVELQLTKKTQNRSSRIDYCSKRYMESKRLHISICVENSSSQTYTMKFINLKYKRKNKMPQ